MSFQLNIIPFPMKGKQYVCLSTSWPERPFLFTRPKPAHWAHLGDPGEKVTRIKLADRSARSHFRHDGGRPGDHTRNACRASELKPETSAVGSSFHRLPLDGAGHPKPCFYISANGTVHFI